MSTKDKALANLRFWAEREQEAHDHRVRSSVAARKAGATIYEIAAAAKKTPQGVSKAMRRLGVTVAKNARGV